MAPPPTGPLASRVPPTGPKARSSSTSSASPVIANASTSVPIPVATPLGRHASGGFASSGYGYDRQRAALLTGGSSGQRGRGRPFARGNGMMHPHAPHGQAGPGMPHQVPVPGMGHTFPVPVGMAYQQQQQQMAYTNGYAHYAHTHQQYGFQGQGQGQGQYMDPSMVAGPSTAPYVPPTPTQPSHKATAPRPPSRPATPPPPPPPPEEDDVPDSARIAEVRSPVKITLPRLKEKDKPSKATAQAKSTPMDKAKDTEKGKGKGGGSERQVEFLPRDDTHRSPISITFAATSKAKPKPAQIDLDAAPVMRESNVAATSPRADRRPRTPSPGAPGTPPPDTPPPPTPPPPPPSEPPSSPAIPTSPRAMKKPPTSPRPAPPRIPPPPPPTVDEPPPAPPPAPPPVPPEPKRPPSSPRSRPPSLTRVVAAALPLPVPAVSVAERRSSKWDVPPDAVPSANGVKEEVVPPVVHFRQMPAALVAERINGHGVTVQEEEQDDDEEDDDDDDDDEEDDSPMEQPASSWSREMPPHRQLPPHMATAPPAEAPPPPPPVAPKSPTPPPPPPPEPPWQPPAWFFRRTAGSYLVTLSSDGRKEVSRRTDGMVDGVPVQVVDPRTETKGPEGKGTAKVVQAYRQVTYPWGPLSVGPKPAEPATAVLITGLSPLTTADQIRTFLRPHGRIRELDAKFDPKSGMQLGICWVKFDGPAGSASSIGSGAGRKGATGAGSNAHDVAVAVVKACNGHRVGMTSTERVTVVLDGEGKKAVKAVKEEMEKRYPKPKPIAVAPVPPPKPASVSTMPPPVGTPTSGSGAGTPRPNGVGKLPIPVAVKLHAQAKAEYRTPSRSLPFAPAPKYTPQPAVHSTSNLPTGLPARPLPAGLPARPATQSFTSSFVDAPFDKYDRYDKLDRDRDRERSRKTDRDGGRDRDTYGSRRTTDTYLARSRSRSRSRSYSRSPSRSRFRSRSRSRSLSTDYTSDSDSDSDSYRRRRYHSPASRRDSHMHTHRGKDTYIPRREVKKAGVDDDDKTREELDKNGKAAVWIDKAVLATTQQNEVHLWDHFRNFRPENILRAPTGFYVLFSDHSSAERAKFLDGSLMHGIKISLVIKTAHVKHDPSQAQIPGQGLGQAQAQKSWQSMTIGKKKPVKPVAKVVSPKVVKKAAGAKVDDVRMVKGVKRSSPSKGREGREVKRRIVYTSDEDEEEYDEAAPAPTVKTSTPVKLVAAAPVESVRPSSPARTSDDVDMEGESEIEPDREPEIAPATQVETAAPTKKRPAAKATPAPAPAAKKAKKGKKARIESPAPLIPPTEIVEPPVAEIKLDELAPAPESAALAANSTETAAAEPDEPKLPKGSKVPKATKVPKVPKAGTAKSARGKKAGMTPLERFIEDEQVVDEEDAYWLSRALALPEGETSDVEDDDAEMDPLVPEDHPLHHTSGAWRVEGLRKVPPALKSAYLPQRNRAQAAAEDASALGGGLTTGRTARASGRRLALDMETHRKTLVHGTGSRDAAASAAAAAAATAENDIFAFNQLRIRKKQLRFARSAIEGYGLYAMETIQPGEMVCEYVGELVRSSVADLREAKYLKQGIGSSYLFRIDADVVCDATFRGSVSRLINHSCDPSASAKIISINGQSKIVIYAKRLLSPGEEILYDYKFPLESDPALRVPCLCGSKICRGFLN